MFGWNWKDWIKAKAWVKEEEIVIKLLDEKKKVIKFIINGDVNKYGEGNICEDDLIKRI